MPNILAIKAQEYYVNKDQDDVNNGLVDSLIEEIKPDDSTIIIGENLIRPKTTYKYRYNGTEDGDQFEAGSEEESDPQDKNITERAMANKEVIFFM